MIKLDLTRYYGCTPAPWRWYSDKMGLIWTLGDLEGLKKDHLGEFDCNNFKVVISVRDGRFPKNEANARLIEDAPKLLEEIKALRK